MRNLTPPIGPTTGQTLVGVGAGVAVVIGIFLTISPIGGDNGFVAGLAALVVASVIVTGLIYEGAHRMQMERINAIEERQTEILRELRQCGSDMHDMSEVQLRLMRIFADGSHVLSGPPTGHIRRSN